MRSHKEAETRLKEFSEKVEKSVLMIDGKSLDFMMSNSLLEERFFSIATLAPSVCVCRCSPT